VITKKVINFLKQCMNLNPSVISYILFYIMRILKRESETEWQINVTENFA
jgi:hypothetical protein